MICRICKKVDCDDDCEELAAIYRKQQKEKLQDIDLSDMDECMACGCPIDSAYNLCFSCEHGLGDYDEN